MNETAQRVRQYLASGPQTKHNRPMVVVVSKSDIWAPLIDLDVKTDPFVTDAAAGDGRFAIDLSRVEATSKSVRDLILRHAPEFIAAAETFCQHVIYVPISSLGGAPQINEATGLLGIRPQEINPQWVTVPMLYALAKWSRVIPGVSSPSVAAGVQPA